MTDILFDAGPHFPRPVSKDQWYVPVPFEVPPAGAPGLRVTVDYPHEAARIDVGLWDPSGFRGWSGSERSRLSIGPAGATPGYLPGEIAPGVWAVWLGLYVVPDPGIDLSIRVEAVEVPADVDRRPPLASWSPRPPRRVLPTEGSGTWLAGDLHCHTIHSDGAFSVEEVTDQARAAGLDFLAITDHNTTSHHAELAAASAASGVQLLPGQETTNYDGHANAFGVTTWVDFRRPADDWMDTVLGASGLLSVNHPVAGDCSWQLPMRRPPHLVELWPGGWDRQAGAAIDVGVAVHEQLGRPIAVGGSDFHRRRGLDAIGQPTSWVLAHDGDVLAGLASGRTTISARRDGPVIVPMEDTLVVVDGAGTTLHDQSGRAQPIAGSLTSVKTGPGVHWLEHAGLVEAVCYPHASPVPRPAG